MQEPNTKFLTYLKAFFTDLLTGIRQACPTVLFDSPDTVKQHLRSMFRKFKLPESGLYTPRIKLTVLIMNGGISWEYGASVSLQQPKR